VIDESAHLSTLWLQESSRIGYIGDMRRHVNWLVLFFIVIIVGGMLAAAVVRVRDLANRESCRNNLKTIGLAVHNYHETYNYFPPGTMPNPSLGPEQRFSWLFSIFPFVEAGYIYQKCDKTKSWDAEENRFAGLTLIYNYRCPSIDWPPASTPFPTHYLGIAGIGKDAANLAKNDPKAGFFGYDRKITFDDIKDGVIFTLIAVETARPSGAWTAGGPETLRGLDPDESPYMGANGPFGGNHFGGTNVLVVDGSVHFLKTGFDPATFEALATIAGGETISNEIYKLDYLD